MGDEVYYRGESSNHQPAKPGQYSMDFGDGLYLTSERSTAEIYAKKRVLQTGGVEVVTQVTIKPGELGRVLDLTTDTRWAKFISTPMVPGRNDTSPAMLMRVQQNNHAIFQEFLRQHKIDIAQYDTVKGAELTHGGNQIVILHKNGAPASLAQRIRVRLASVRSVAPGVPAIKVPFRVRAGMAVRSVAGGLVMLGLSYLAARWRAKVDKSWIEKGLKDIQPEVDNTLKKRVPHIADVLSKGKKAYANVTVEIRQRSVAAAGTDYVDALPVVKLTFVDVSAEDLNAEGVMKSDSGFGYTTRITPYLFSYEVTVPAEIVKAWSEMMDEWKWYENQMQKTPTVALQRQQEHFRREIVDAFGEEANLVLDAWMWPKFKFKAKGA